MKTAGLPRQPNPAALYIMYSPARSAVSVESEDGWVVWFAAEAPDGQPRRARPPRAPAPKLQVPKPPAADGGMGQTLGELAAALADALGRRDAALSERDAAVAERDAAVAALAAAKKPANGHAPTKRRSPAKTPPRSQKSSKPSPAAVSRSPASSKARSPPKRAPPPRPPPSPVPSSRSSARPARLRDEARQLAELVQATATVVEKRRTLATARLEAARAKRPASPAWRGPSPSPTRPPLDRTRLAYAPSPPTKNRPKTRGRSRKDAQRAAAAALDRARSVFKRAGYTASGIDFSRLFPRGITLDADEFRSGVRRVLKVAPSTLSDADVRRVFRSVESEDAVALDALLAFVEA